MLAHDGAMKLLGSLLLLAAAATSSFAFVNEDVKTKLDLSKQVVRLSHVVSVAAAGSSGSQYRVGLPSSLAEHVAKVDAKSVTNSAPLEVSASAAT